MSMPADMDVVDTDRASDPLPVLKALAEPLRWQIVAALAREELCVCHLTDDLGAPQPLVSHHLRTLREAGIVETERWRYWTYYRLRPRVLEAISANLRSLAEASGAVARQRRPCG
jgi:ArsR family transcriptional regulator, arsenate/arsenite/antimonite-responsive transcriptional repressor